MRQIDRFLIGALVLGVWSLVALQMTSTTYAQELSAGEQGTQNDITVIHATDIVGLSAMIQAILRHATDNLSDRNRLDQYDHQFRPQSMLGLDQYVKSIVRNCRISCAVRYVKEIELTILRSHKYCSGSSIQTAIDVRTGPVRQINSAKLQNQLRSYRRSNNVHKYFLLATTGLANCWNTAVFRGS